MMSKFDKHFKMDEKDAIEYVKEKLNYFTLDAEIKAEEIGDGNINYVFKVWNEKTKQSLIIKHADVLLRSSGRALDIDRNRIEATVLLQQGKSVPELVPVIYKYDPIMCVLVMEDISEYENLRMGLLNRKIYPTLSEDITTFMVKTLLPTTDLMLDSGEKKDKVKEFINKDLCKISEDLVFTEPYNDYKKRNIILKENLEFVKKELYMDKKLILEVGKLKNNYMNNAQALIHGDLHTGSIFAKESGIKILDPEFAFYGPMGYDVGNVIGNLFFSWVNAYVTESPLEIEKFVGWISETIESVIDLFKKKFVKFYGESEIDIVAREKEYMEWYLDRILSDTAGSAGLEIIRRVVGDSKVIEVTNVTDIEKRLKLERMLIFIGKEMILNREKMKTGKDYVKIFEIYK